MMQQLLHVAGFPFLLDGYRMTGTFEVFEQTSGDTAPALTAEVIPLHDYSALHMPDVRHHTATESSILMQNDDRLVFTSSNDLFACVEYSADYAHARHYFNHREYGDLRAAPRETLDFHFFLELRRQMIGYLFRRGDLVLHSVSVLYGGEAFALSAQSGTGKSTHGQLWTDHFGAQILNGDLNACRLIGGQPHLCALPWCGSSEIAHNVCAPLRAIVFLEQAPMNEVRRLPPAESVMRLAARCYLPRWDANLMGGDYLAPVEALAAKTPCYLLKCTPDREAAEVLRACLY